jgi:hypothetical protein
MGLLRFIAAAEVAKASPTENGTNRSEDDYLGL